jgi:predicted SAM-dependent methyltransferase
VLKLNLGAGVHQLNGYENLDGSKGDVIYPLAYTEVDEVRASHVLEHFGHEESVHVLLNWFDALKGGGVLKLAVPDFDDLMRRRALGQDLPFEAIIMGGQTDERDFHKSIWNLDKLRTLMEMIGLVDIQTWQSEVMDCAAYPFSLNLQGVKK